MRLLGSDSGCPSGRDGAADAGRDCQDPSLR